MALLFFHYVAETLSVLVISFALPRGMHIGEIYHEKSGYLKMFSNV